MRRPDRREKRQTEAAERQADRDARGDYAQLKRLVEAGHGHCKEAKRLHDRGVMRLPDLKVTS